MRSTSDTSPNVDESIEVYDLGVVPYSRVQDIQTQLRRAVGTGSIPGVLLLLEHEPVITLGARASTCDILDAVAAEARGLEIARSERGGQTTMHAPGQLVCYPIVPIPRRDLRAYVHDLEEVLLLLLAGLHINAERLDRRPGVYVEGRKIASLGLKCERGIASHGVALNVSVDLSLFDLVVSCGDSRLRQTSVQELTQRDWPMGEIKTRCVGAFAQVFGTALPTLRAPSAISLADLSARARPDT
jgi:lipoate-protein ligase B